MKKDIHPKYYPGAKVVCACGNTFEVGSTEPELHVEVCSACHPFYTGTAKFIDTAGRVDKFQERVRKAQEIKAQKIVKKSARGRSLPRRQAGASGGKVVKDDERIASKSKKRASRG